MATIVLALFPDKPVTMRASASDAALLVDPDTVNESNASADPPDHIRAEIITNTSVPVVIVTLGRPADTYEVDEVVAPAAPPPIFRSGVIETIPVLSDLSLPGTVVAFSFCRTTIPQNNRAELQLLQPYDRLHVIFRSDTQPHHIVLGLFLCSKLSEGIMGNQRIALQSKQRVPVAPEMVRQLNLVAAYYYAQLIYYDRHATKDTSGWFDKNSREIYDDIGLGRRQQEHSRKLLVEKGLIETEAIRGGLRPTVRFRII